MLRRNSSKRTIDRRKSTSSVYSRSDHIDPAVARQYAYTAATLAFHRAQERNSTDGGNSGMGNSCHTTNHQRLQLGSTTQPDALGSDAPIIRRQQSVRFVNANGGIERQNSFGTRVNNGAVQRKGSHATLRPVAMTTNAPVPAAYRPPSRSSSIGKAHGSGADELNTVNTYNEYYAPDGEEDVVTTPSSYRRIRKSKSMYSPRKGPNACATNSIPDRPESSSNCARSLLTEPPISQGGEPILRAPKSVSFLRGMRGHGTQERNDDAVQLARDRFFQETMQQRLRNQPSFIFRSNAQRHEKPFRKSFRTGSAQGYDADASLNHVLQSRDTGFRDAARRASRSVKDKLKKVFGRGKDEPVAIPNQQVEAKSTHLDDYNGGSSALDMSFADVPQPDLASLTSVNHRVGSLHDVPSDQQLRSHVGSVRSFQSHHSEEKSRVSSWQSTEANTTANFAAKIQAELDQQRLSIINEIGTHVPSSSLNHTRSRNQFAVCPTNSPSGLAGENVVGPTAVDSARVYSALMKRLDENSPRAKLRVSRAISRDMSSSRPERLHYKTEFNSNSHGKSSPATIRQVLPSETTDGSDSEESSGHDHQWVQTHEQHSARAEDILGYTGRHVHQWRRADSLREARMRSTDDVFSPADEGSSDKENKPPGEHFQDPQSTGKSRPALQEVETQKSSRYSRGPTPQDIALQNEPVVSSRPIRDSRSTFFGGGGGYTLPRKQSPFKRAMAENKYTSMDVTDSSIASRQSPVKRTPMIVTSARRSREQRDDAYSESVYSRDTSEQTVLESQLSLSPPKDNLAKTPQMSPRDHPGVSTLSRADGDAMIINQTTYQPTRPGSDLRHHRVIDSAGSVEWKTWMAAEVSRLETSKENMRAPSCINYALPTMPKSFGHVRELAQINDDSENDIRQRNANIIKQPLGIIHQQSTNINPPQNLKPILKKRSTTSLTENLECNVSVESTLVSSIPPPLPPLPPPLPPLPNRRPLRSVPSKSSICSTGRTMSTLPINASSSHSPIQTLTSHKVPHKRNVSQTTLRTFKSTNASIQNIETPAKLIKRSRPSTAPRLQSSVVGKVEVAVDRQLRSTSSNSRYKTLITGRRGEHMESLVGEEEDPYGIDGTGLMGPGVRVSTSEGEAQAMGSKHMVELFLSSRRKRFASGSEEAGSIFL